MVVWLLAGNTNKEEEEDYLNAVGLTGTSSARKTAGIIVKIKPSQRAPGLEGRFCRGQAVSLHRHVMHCGLFPKTL